MKYKHTTGFYEKLMRVHVQLHVQLIINDSVCTYTLIP